MAEAVKVIVRCRPMNSREKGLDCKMVVEMDQGIICQLFTPDDRDSNDPPKSFAFDGAYHIDSTTEAIYNDVGFPIVESVLEGYNGTVFAYGQTGCGKSFSMQGIQDPATQRGIIPRAFEHIFEMIQTAEDMKYLVMASYLEIYNEEIRDLLGNDVKKKLDLKEHPDKGVYVQGLSQHPVHNTAECEQLMESGWSNRATGATLMNADSSRSHSIFTIMLEMMGTTGESDTIRSGKLNLVDLAGSERQAKTGATGDRLKEATKINLSLSALGNVISALVDGRSKHIPYRDSKLTRLLQDSLGGNTKTLMVACLSPADNNYDETLSTLRYANRAKNIKNKPKINEDPKDAMLREYQEEIQKLKTMLETQGGGATVMGADGVPVPVVPPAAALEEEREKIRREYEEQMEELKKEKEKEEQSKQAMQSEVDELRKKYEEELAQLAEESRLKQEELQREQQLSLQRGPPVPRRGGLDERPVGVGGGGVVNVVDGYEEDWEDADTTTVERVKGPPATTGVLKTKSNQHSISSEQKAALKRLREIQEKMVGGEKKEDKELKAKRQKRKKYMEKRLKILSEALKDVDEEDGIMLKVYDDIHEELRVKTELAKNQKQKIKSLEAEIEDITGEFQNERTDYLETIRKLDQQAKLLQSILDKVQPTIRRDCNYSNLDSIKKEAIWDEEYQRWRVPDLSVVKTKLPPAGMQPGGRAATSKGGYSSPRGINGGWLVGDDDVPIAGLGMSVYNNSNTSSDESPEDSFERDVKSDGYLKKLQKGEQEDIAGNYFKPKRANELLVRFQDEPGSRRNVGKKAPTNHGLGMSLSQSMWGSALSNSLGSNMQQNQSNSSYNSSWGSNASNSSTIVPSNSFGSYGNGLGQSFAAGSGGFGSIGGGNADNGGGLNNNGWLGNNSSGMANNSSVSPDSRKPGRLDALQPLGGIGGGSMGGFGGIAGPGAGGIGLGAGGGMSSFGGSNFGSSIVAGRRTGATKKISRDDLDTLHL